MTSQFCRRVTLLSAMIGFCGITSVLGQSINPSIVQVDNTRAESDPYWIPGTLTYDLQVTVTGECGQPNDWTVADVSVQIWGCEWYEHPLGTDASPNPNNFQYFPALEFDSYYCGADTDLSDGAPEPYFAPGSPESVPCQKICSWYDSTNLGNGTFTIARFSLRPLRERWAMQVEGQLYQLCTGGAAWQFQSLVTTPPCNADLDLDFDVDLSDLATLLAHYGVDGGGDTDCDGDTDLDDLAALLTEYGCF